MFQSISSEKKLKKPLKFFFLEPIYIKKGSSWATPKTKNNFFDRNNKSRSSSFRNILFNQNIICFDWVMNLFVSWVMFFVKKMSFLAKTAVYTVKITQKEYLLIWNSETADMENRNSYFLSYKAWKNNMACSYLIFINISFILNFWPAILSKTKVFI